MGLLLHGACDRACVIAEKKERKLAACFLRPGAPF